MLLDTTRELFASLREGQRVRLLINGEEVDRGSILELAPPEEGRGPGCVRLRLKKVHETRQFDYVDVDGRPVGWYGPWVLDSKSHQMMPDRRRDTSVYEIQPTEC